MHVATTLPARVRPQRLPSGSINVHGQVQDTVEGRKQFLRYAGTCSFRNPEFASNPNRFYNTQSHKYLPPELRAASGIEGITTLPDLFSVDEDHPMLVMDLWSNTRMTEDKIDVTLEVKGFL